MTNKPIGKIFTVYMTVFNKVGFTTSDSVVFLLADVPSKPNPPTRVSDGRSLTILITAPQSDGGSQITSYQLQIMLPGQQNWITVLGEENSNLQLNYTLTNE